VSPRGLFAYDPVRALCLARGQFAFELYAPP
jgi:hypothetical protein